MQGSVALEQRKDEAFKHAAMRRAFAFSVVDHSAKVNVLFQERLARVRRVTRYRNREEREK
jgi:hypothetical protein